MLVNSGFPLANVLISSTYLRLRNKLPKMQWLQTTRVFTSLPSLASGQVSARTAHLQSIRQQLVRLEGCGRNHLEGGVLTCQGLLVVGWGLGQGHDWSTTWCSPCCLETGASIPRKREPETETRDREKEPESEAETVMPLKAAFRSHPVPFLPRSLSLQ